MARKSTTKQAAEVEPVAAPDANEAGPTMTATVPDVEDIPAGTPVVSKDGQIGKVLSHDPITGQVQIALDGGGRGWYARGRVSVDGDRDA